MAPHSSTLAWKVPWTEEPESRTRLSDFTCTFHFHALEKEMATHSSVLAWRIPGTGEPGGLPSMGLHRVGHDWSDSAAARTPDIIGLKNSLSLDRFIFKLGDWCPAGQIHAFLLRCRLLSCLTLVWDAFSRSESSTAQTLPSRWPSGSIPCCRLSMPCTGQSHGWSSGQGLCPQVAFNLMMRQEI